MSDLVVRLREQLDEDERVAREADDDGRRSWVAVNVASSMDEGQAIHIARHDPARVLRQVAATRKLLDWCEMVIASGGPLPEGVSEGRDPDEIERDRAVGEDAQGILFLLAEAYGIEWAA